MDESCLVKTPCACSVFLLGYFSTLSVGLSQTG